MTHGWSSGRQVVVDMKAGGVVVPNEEATSVVAAHEKHSIRCGVLMGGPEIHCVGHTCSALSMLYQMNSADRF